MLVGSLDTARLLLDSAEKLPNVVKWKLDRERGRLALRKGDVAGAATVLSRALEGCGADAETFLLAADTATADDKAAAGLGEKVKKLVPERLKNVPEAAIVEGKLALAAEKYPEALALYTGAKAALEQANASSRRKAQARFGIAVAKYFQHFDVEAERELQAVIALDPSLYAAYLFDATLLQTKKPKEALELAKHAVTLDPDSVDGWTLAGQLAHKLGDKRTFAEAISKLTAIAPTSDALKSLQALKR